MAASDESKLTAVSNVDIDDSGRFKYVLIKCYLGEKTKDVVRGYSWAEYHGIFLKKYLLAKENQWRKTVHLHFRTPKNVIFQNSEY